MVVDRYCAEGIQAGTKVAKNDVRMSFKCHSIPIRKANPKVGFSILIKPNKLLLDHESNTSRYIFSRNFQYV
jgi:hypothetical protein